MNTSSLLSRLESLLFVHGEPLAVKKIGQLLSLSEGEIRELLQELEKHLEDDERGLLLVTNRETVQLVTKPSSSELIETFVKKELTEDLTPASLETLSIVAYLGPLSRSRIEYIRGVNSLFTLRTLRMRGLVERVPNPESPNSFLYEISFDLLRHLGLQKQEDLPEFRKFRTLLEQVQFPQNTGEHV